MDLALPFADQSCAGFETRLWYRREARVSLEGADKFGEPLSDTWRQTAQGLLLDPMGQTALKELPARTLRRGGLEALSPAPLQLTFWQDQGYNASGPVNESELERTSGGLAPLAWPQTIVDSTIGTKSQNRIEPAGKMSAKRNRRACSRPSPRAASNSRRSHEGSDYPCPGRSAKCFLRQTTGARRVGYIPVLVDHG